MAITPAPPVTIKSDGRLRSWFPDPDVGRLKREGPLRRNAGSESSRRRRSRPAAPALTSGRLSDSRQSCTFSGAVEGGPLAARWPILGRKTAAHAPTRRRIPAERWPSVRRRSAPSAASRSFASLRSRVLRTRSVSAPRFEGASIRLPSMAAKGSLRLRVSKLRPTGANLAMLRCAHAARFASTAASSSRSAGGFAAFRSSDEPLGRRRPHPPGRLRAAVVRLSPQTASRSRRRP